MDRTCRFDYRRGPLALVLGGGTVGLVFAAVCLVAGLVLLAGESAAGVVDGPRDRRNRLVKDDLFKEPPSRGTANRWSVEKMGTVAAVANLCLRRACRLPRGAFPLLGSSSREPPKPGPLSQRIWRVGKIWAYSSYLKNQGFALTYPFWGGFKAI